MFRPYMVDENHFDYDCGIEHLKAALINDGMKADADAEAVLEFIEDMSLEEYKIYYLLTFQGLSDYNIKKRLAQEIAECEAW